MMLAPWIPGHFWTAVGWPTIHFVWIGLLTGILVALALVFLRAARSRVPFRLALALFALGALSLGAYFIHQVAAPTSPSQGNLLAGGAGIAERESGSPLSVSPDRRIRFRLDPKSSAWTVGQDPIFAVGVRNLGDRKIHLCSSQAGWELEVDGTWYRPSQEPGSGTSALFPGEEWVGLPVVLDDGAWRTLNKDRQTQSVRLVAGRHQLRLRARVTLCDPPNQDRRSFKLTSNSAEVNVFETMARDDNGKQSGPEPAQPSRTLLFPPHRSLGTLYIQDRSVASDRHAPRGLLSGSQWKYYAPGKGLVLLPPNQRVWLDLEVPIEFRDLSPLTTLDPGALDTVTILAVGERRNDRDELLLAQLRNMTGLRVLGLSNIKVTPRGMTYLENLCCLETLSILSPFSSQTNQTWNDACLQTLIELTNLVTLRLTGTQFTDDGLAKLAKLPGLAELDLEGDYIEGRELVHLKQLPKLHSLRLRGPPMNELTISQLAGLGSLRNMDLDRVRLTNAILAAQWNFPLLDELILHDAHVTREGWSFLKALPALRRLSIWIGASNSCQIDVGETTEFMALRSLEQLELHNAVVTDAALAKLATLPRLRSLRLPAVSEIEPNMDGRQYSDLGLEALAGCSGLEELSVGSLRVTDSGIGSIGKMKNLKRLGLFAPRISNAALRPIACLTSLELLALDASRVTFSGLNQLNTLTNLRELHLASVQRDRQALNLSRLTRLESISIQRRGIKTDASSFDSEDWKDEDMACLASLTNLRRLWGIRGISDRGMRHLIGLDSMEWLDIGGLAVTDASVAYFGKMRNLKCLNLSGRITDHGVLGLEGLKSLRYLNLGMEATISGAAVNRLHQTLPELKVHYGHPELGAGG